MKKAYMAFSEETWSKCM